MSVAYEPSMETIARMCSGAFGISIPQIMSRRRDRETAATRQAAMWLCRRLTKRSLPEIARYFQREDHTTVMCAVKRVEARLEAEPPFGKQIEGIMSALAPVETPAETGFPAHALDMEGRRVRLKRRMRTALFVMPPGTVGTITLAPSWRTMRFMGDACRCCGMQGVLTVVTRDDVELVA